jgi:hypothetical protein
MGLVGFDLHAAAAAVALLAPPQLAIHKFEIDRHARGKPADHRDQSFAVRLPGTGKSDHSSLDCNRQ